MKRFMAKLGSDKPAQQSGQQFAAPPGAPPPRQSGFAPPTQSYAAPGQYAPPAQPAPGQQPYSSGSSGPQGYVPPGAASGGAPGEDPLNALRRYDMVFCVDDSGSMEMEPLWQQCRDALMGVVDVASNYDDDGVDVHFMNSSVVGKGLRSVDEVARLFRRVEPRGSTPTAAALARILTPYMDLLEREKAAGRKVKPLNLIVLTDGSPDPRGGDPTPVIVDIGKRLDAGKFPPFQLGIQFLQVGDDDQAAAFLATLDDDLKSKHGVRDMVDTVAFSVNGGVVTRELIIKTLLGGVNRSIDKR